MTFFEAVEYARKTGKQVKSNACPVLVEWRDGCLMWAGTGHAVSVKQSLLDATWSIAEPMYTFSEAYAMMKQGKPMRSIDGGHAIYCDGSVWKVASNVWVNVTFTPEQIEGKWVEAD